MRTFIKHLFLFCLSCIVVSCNEKPEEIIDFPDDDKQITKDPLTFDVQVTGDSDTFKVGDTVLFSIEGNPDLISFYSGTVGNSYDYINTDRFYDVVASLSFQSAKSAGNNPDCASLYYSDEFDGNYTYENVKQINWIPITNRFELDPLPEVAGLTNTFSGDIDVTDAFASGKPIYFAWHCTTNAASQRTQFRVQEFTLNSIVVDNPDLSTVLYTQAGANFHENGWLLNEEAATQGSNLPTASSTQLLWNGIFNNRSGPFKEGYIVSNSMELPQFNAGKDKPTVLLPENDNTWPTHEFIYSRPGTYEVVFIASHMADGDSEPILKAIEITIEE